MAVNRMLFRAMLPSWTRAGLSGVAMIRRARSMGIPTYRRGLMYQDFRHAARRVDAVGRLAEWSIRRRPTASVMAEIPLRRPAKYRVYGRFRLLDIKTGEIFEKEKSFYTDRLMSPQGWTDDIIDSVNRSPAGDTAEFLSGTIDLIEHNEGFPY